jgi:hypothetical protein
LKMAKTRRLAFFEFPHEVDAYVKGHASSASHRSVPVLISLNPRTQAHLKRHGLAGETSLSYCTNDSHACALRQSQDISEWLWKRVQFKDNLGVSFAYAQSLVWFIRLFAHHCFFLLEIIRNATERHEAESLWVPLVLSRDLSGPLVGSRESYLAALAEAFARDRGLSVEPFQVRAAYRYGSFGEAAKALQRHVAKRIVAPVAGPIYRRYLRSLGPRGLTLFTAGEYRMSDIARTLSRERPNLPSLMMREWGHAHELGNLFGMRNGSAYDAEVWLGLVETTASEDESSRYSLQVLLRDLGSEIGLAHGVFSFHGVSFAELVRLKLEQGIGPFILDLHRRAVTLYLLLDLLKPACVISAGNRADDMITGELCRASGIPAMLISHGSHVFPKSDLEKIEWGEQGHRLIRAPYPHVAVQSPLAEEFLSVLPPQGQRVRTGPLMWGRPVDRERSAVARRRLLGRDTSRSVIVHANTPKGRQNYRFHVYETPDEYVQTIQDLAAAVAGLPRVHLVVKFRPSQDITVEDLQTLVPFSERVTLSVNESFLDVLGIADLLVSFSSTTIEEALQNHIPVLLYGGGGRYQHVPGVEITPDKSCPLAAVYAVRQREYLAGALSGILDIHGLPRQKDPLFARYCFDREAVVGLGEWLSASVSKGEFAVSAP